MLYNLQEKKRKRIENEQVMTFSNPLQFFIDHQILNIKV